MKSRLLPFLALTVAAPLVFAQPQGVSKNEIVIGTIQDLSGPIAGFGKQARLGMLLRVPASSRACARCAIVTASC